MITPWSEFLIMLDAGWCFAHFLSLSKSSASVGTSSSVAGLVGAITSSSLIKSRSSNSSVNLSTSGESPFSTFGRLVSSKVTWTNDYTDKVLLLKIL